MSQKLIFWQERKLATLNLHIKLLTILILFLINVLHFLR